MSTRFTPSAATASGCSAGAWCANASNASASASSSRPSTIASSACQLVVAHDQYGCASRSACAGLLDRHVDTRAVAELEEVFDHSELRGEHAFGGNVVDRQRERLPSVGDARDGAGGPHERDPARLQAHREIVGVVRASRFAQATLRELVALGFGVGEHEGERELAEHGDEEVDVGVVESRERVAQERGTRGVFEIDCDAASAATDQRQRCAGRGAAAMVRTSDPERDPDRRPALAGMTERSLRTTKADERGALLVDLGCEVGRDGEVIACDRPRRLGSAARPAASRLRVASSALVAPAAT